MVEEYLDGEELSLLALCDGERALPLASAQDYKRIFDGDAGPNTGGMGSYSPVPAIERRGRAEICAAVHQPVLDELRRRGTPFHGVLYAGLMMTADGPKVLEFNVRFGDPETQAILPRLRSDLLELLAAATGPGGLAGAALEWDDPSRRSRSCWPAAGYPERPSSGDVITASTRCRRTCSGHPRGHRAGRGRARSSRPAGGCSSVTALGADAAAARDAAYAAADMIDFDGRQLRRDIARRARKGME